MPEYLDDLIRVAAGGALPGGERWVNVFHCLRTPGTGEALTLTEAGEISGPIVGFYDTFNASLSSEWSLDTTIVKDQESQSGPSYDVDFTTIVGGTSGEDLPNQVALVVSWLTSLAGRRNRGRNYLAGFTEASSGKIGRVQLAP